MLKLLKKVASDRYELLDKSTGEIGVVSSRDIFDLIENYDYEIEGVDLFDNTAIFTDLNMKFEKRLTGNKYRIYPTKTQVKFLEKCFRCSVFIYNKMLSERRSFYERTGETLITHYNDYTDKYMFLKEVPQKILQYSERNLNRAFMNFFRRVRNGKIIPAILDLNLHVQVINHFKRTILIIE